MVILWVYFLVPLMIGRNVSGFTTMLCTLVIYEGAYLSEVVRAGIQALPRGQMEAARALGNSYLGAMWSVILPQALYNMLPSMLSQWVSTIKETTLGYVINVHELTFAASQINNQLLTKPFQVFFILALTYFIVCWSLTQLANWMERRIASKRLGVAGAKPRTKSPVPELQPQPE
jgi:polar amino acid transport system permease protein